MNRGFSNEPDAANPAIASLFQARRQWRGVADPGRFGDVAMPRRIVIITTMGFALLVTLACLSFPQRSVVAGKLSSQDLAVIEFLVHRTNGREPILPDYSWQSLRRLPQAILRPRDRILSIAASNGVVEVEALLAVPREKGITRGVTYKLQQSSNAWDITAHQFWIGPESLR